MTAFIRDNSRGWETPNIKITNMLIEGENLNALLLLEKTYTKKIDCIYLDPPYNTLGKELSYEDTRSDWIIFMKERLIISKKLLSTNGVIFISIDDHEIARLRILCDDIFGKNNHLGTLVIINHPGGRNSGGNYSLCHDYVLVYANKKQANLIQGRNLNEDEQKEYKYVDDISRYKLAMLRKTGETDKRLDRPNLFYPIYWNQTSNTLSLINKNGWTKILPIRADGSEGRWRWGKNTFEKRMNTEIVIKLSNTGYPIPYLKIRNTKERKRKYKSIMSDPSYTSKRGTEDLSRILGSKDLFPYAKPVELLKDLIRSATNTNSIVLDFFAGSGTTGQAVYELNKEDNGQRQFILVTNNETSEKLPDGVCHQVTYPRLEKTTNEGTSLLYFTIHQDQ